MPGMQTLRHVLPSLLRVFNLCHKPTIFLNVTLTAEKKNMARCIVTLQSVRIKMHCRGNITTELFLASRSWRRGGLSDLRGGGGPYYDHIIQNCNIPLTVILTYSKALRFLWTLKYAIL